MYLYHVYTTKAASAPDTAMQYLHAAFTNWLDQKRDQYVSKTIKPISVSHSVIRINEVNYVATMYAIVEVVE